MNARSLFCKFLVGYLLANATGMRAEVKETHAIIGEWVATERLISEEENEWDLEKSTLLDLQQALTAEMAELNAKLKETEEEAVGAAKQREDLLARKEEALQAMGSLHRGIDRAAAKLDRAFSLLPTPLADRLAPYRKKLVPTKGMTMPPLRQRVDALVSLLQAMQNFHKSVTLERQEFTLDDNQSREFQVMYFGLGAAYFVNESGTVAGYGQPGDQGWKWTRSDGLAREISTGVDMLNNRAMPRFLELPVLSPERIDP
ncbi:MAG: DUF3450 family protein [Opitutae bacterium]